MSIPSRRCQFEQRLDDLLNELSRVTGSIGNMEDSTLGPLPQKFRSHPPPLSVVGHADSCPAIMLKQDCIDKVPPPSLLPMSPPLSSGGETEVNVVTASKRREAFKKQYSYPSSASTAHTSSSSIRVGTGEDTCGSTKYNSDSDTTMSCGSASGSNPDFLSRLEQTAAKQPGSSTAPLPFSYLAMANTNSGNHQNYYSHNPTSHSSNGVMNSSGYHSHNVNASPQSPYHSSGYQSNGGMSAEPYLYEEEESRPVMSQTRRPVPPPPPPPLPKPGRVRQARQVPPSTQPNQQGYGQASHTMPTSAFYAPGPGSGVFAHAQYNSPIGLYSNDNAAEAFRMASGGVVTNVAPLPSESPQPQQHQEAFQKTALYKLIQEEENRQQRHGSHKQLSGDDTFQRNGTLPSNIGNPRRLTTLTMQRQRPGSSMAHFAPANRVSPKECYDQVIATLPRRPNRWSAKPERRQVEFDGADVARQAALKARCSSATRCFLNTDGEEDDFDSPALDDRQIRYRGAKIPSRTFQLLHAYTELTAKDDDVAPTKENGEIATVVISDGPSNSKPRVRPRPSTDTLSRMRDDQSEASEFDRTAIRGDEPPRHAVPSRSFLALQAVLNSQPTEPSEESNKEDTSEQQKNSEEGGENAAESIIKPVTKDAAQHGNAENSEAEVPLENQEMGSRPSLVNGNSRQFTTHRPPSTYPAPRPPAASVKVPVVPSRIRPCMPRAPTWDRSNQPKKWQVTSLRTPASRPNAEQPTNGSHNGYYPNQPRYSAGAESAPEAYHFGPNIDEPYRLAKLKVMTGNNRGPRPMPRAISQHRVANGTGADLSRFGDTTDF